MIKYNTDQAYLHGDCNPGEIEFSYKKKYPKVSYSTSKMKITEGITRSSEDEITVEYRKCKGCKGCYLIGKTRWFIEPTGFPTKVFWPKEFVRLRDFAKSESKSIFGNPSSPYHEDWRIVYYLQRIALRCLFEKIPNARKALDPETLSVVLDECYLGGKEEWTIEKPANPSEKNYDTEEQRHIYTANNIIRSFNLISYLFNIIGQGKFFFVVK